MGGLLAAGQMDYAAGGLGAGGRPSGPGLGWACWMTWACLGGLLVGLGLFQTSLGLRLGGLGVRVSLGNTKVIGNTEASIGDVRVNLGNTKVELAILRQVLGI